VCLCMCVWVCVCVNVCTETTASNPDSPRSWYLLGVCEALLGDNDKAINHIGKCESVCMLGGGGGVCVGGWACYCESMDVCWCESKKVFVWVSVRVSE